MLVYPAGKDGAVVVLRYAKTIIQSPGAGVLIATEEVPAAA